MRVATLTGQDPARSTRLASRMKGTRIATSSSVRNGTVGLGGAIHDTSEYVVYGPPTTYSTTVGLRTEQNPYVAELASMAEAMRRLTPQPYGRKITVFTSNQGALPRKRQSGQVIVGQIYKASKTLRQCDNRVQMMWVPAGYEFSLLVKAKGAAQQATESDRVTHERMAHAKSTTLRRIISSQQQRNRLPEGVGQHSRRVDIALPGPHTPHLYDSLGRREASELVQLRTGMTRLNVYLHQIGGAESDQCPYGHAKETVEHFLFRCRLWDSHRADVGTDRYKQRQPFLLPGGKGSSG